MTVSRLGTGVPKAGHWRSQGEILEFLTVDTGVSCIGNDWKLLTI